MCICAACPRRYVTISLTFLGMLFVHAMRVNLAVTVVTILDDVPTAANTDTMPHVAWSSRMIGFLHATFYIGYLVSQIPSGYLATKLASHRLFGGCIMISSALNLLLPVAIDDVGYPLACTIRGAQGLSEGMLFPSCYSIMHHWTTPEERSKMGAIVLTGVYLGPVLGLVSSGYFTHYLGWHYIYYLHGGVGILWFALWMSVAYETPDDHPTIREEERKLIKDRQGSSGLKYENLAVPWKAIFTSLPVNALNVCNFARSFVFFLLLTNGPAYINVFDFTMAENGVLCAMPHAVMAFIAMLSGPIADYLIGQPLFSATLVRKLLTCIGFGVEAVCLGLLGFINQSTIALTLLTIGVGISGFTISGWQINHLDLSPRYASVLVAITTTVGTVAGIISPIIVGELTKHQTLDNWHTVFLITAGVLAFAVLFYISFGSGEMQPWSEPVQRVTIIGSTETPEKPPYGTFPVQVGATRSLDADDVNRLTPGGATGGKTTPHIKSCEANTRL